MFQSGDLVRVKKNAKKIMTNSPYGWGYGMEEMIGCEYTVEYVFLSNAVRLVGEHWTFAEEALVHADEDLGVIKRCSKKELEDFIGGNYG